MRDIGPSQTKDPRVACEGPLGKFRKLPIIPGRQVVVDLAQLLFHKVEVVQQPLCRRSDHLTRLQGFRTGAIGLQKDVGIRADPAAQRLNPQQLVRGDQLCRGKRLRVML